jgi:Na+-transporting methylmalonyl-CoA/oxaloacetate decarboxylase gamma subunit
VCPQCQGANHTKCKFLNMTTVFRVPQLLIIIKKIMSKLKEQAIDYEDRTQEELKETNELEEYDK